MSTEVILFPWAIQGTCESCSFLESIEVILIPWAIQALPGIIAGCAVAGIVISKKMHLEKESRNKKLLVGSECSEEENFFVTKMNNYNLLKNSLEKIEHKIIICDTNDQIELITNDFSVIFRKNENTDSFRANFYGKTENDDCEKFLNDLYEEYTRQVQQAVYLELIEKAKKKNIQLESEEILEDNSILLTLDVDKMF